jgi:multidrug efflux pump
MISELEGNIITAIFLVMVLVIASMGLRVGLLVGLSIPFLLSTNLCNFTTGWNGV